MSTVSRSPRTGSIEKATPAASSALTSTICWTTTAIEACRWSSPSRSRYFIACAFHREA